MWMLMLKQLMKRGILDFIFLKVMIICRKHLKSERKSITNIFKKQTSHNIFRRKLSKILEFSKFKRDTARVNHDEKVKRLKMKHGRIKDEFVLPDEISEFSECRMFQSNPDVNQRNQVGLR